MGERVAAVPREAFGGGPSLWGRAPSFLLSRPDARAVRPPATARQAARPRPGRAACPRFGALGRLCRRVLLVWAKVWGLRHLRAL